MLTDWRPLSIHYLLPSTLSPANASLEPVERSLHHFLLIFLSFLIEERAISLSSPLRSSGTLPSEAQALRTLWVEISRHVAYIISSEKRSIIYATWHKAFQSLLSLSVEPPKGSFRDEVTHSFRWVRDGGSRFHPLPAGREREISLIHPAMA